MNARKYFCFVFAVLGALGLSGLGCQATVGSAQTSAVTPAAVLRQQGVPSGTAAGNLILVVKAATKTPNILEKHLRMGTPTGPTGEHYGVNSLYFTRNGEPWLPVMGEIHYARVPHEYWEESVLAMKAGGIDVISTYVFWIFHEEIQGQYDWQGDRNLRRVP